MRFIAALLVLSALSALPVHAEEATNAPGVGAPTPVTAPQAPRPKPPQLEQKPEPQPLRVENSAIPRPGFYQNAINRAEEVKENLEERGKLFQEQMGLPAGMTRPEFLENQPQIRERILDHASTTRDAILERREAFREQASTTLGNMLERRQDLRERIMERASTTPGALLPRREFLKDEWQEKRARFSSTTEAWKAAWTEEKKQNVAARAEHAANLLDTMLGRLAGIADRIEARIAELSAEGVDVANAEAALEEADAAIADAETAIAAAKAALGTALESEDPQTQAAETKSLMDAAKEALRIAHEALRAVAGTLPKPPEKSADEPVTP